MENTTEFLGWLGMIIIVIAHILISTNKLAGESRVYQSLNLVGAILIATNVFYSKNWPVFTLQIIWALIAIFDLVKYSTKPRRG